MDLGTAITLLTQLLGQASTLGNAIKKAREEGRNDLTKEEVDAFVAKDDEARARLQAAIDGG